METSSHPNMGVSGAHYKLIKKGKVKIMRNQQRNHLSKGKEDRKATIVTTPLPTPARNTTNQNTSIGTVQSNTGSTPNAHQHNRMASNTQPTSPRPTLNQGTVSSVQSRPNNSVTTRRAPRAIQLIIEPFSFITITQFDCHQAFNAHSVLNITGLIAEGNRMAYANLARKQVQVCAKALDENGTEIILFQGVLTNLVVYSEYELHTMSIEVKTESFLLDQKPHTRTFQPNDTTYHSMIKTCLDAAKGEFIMRERRDWQANQLTIQYRESDFSFILRLARRLGVVVLPEVKTTGKRLLVGLSNNNRAVNIESSHYTMTQAEPDPNSLIRYELGVYTIKTRDIYELGQKVNFQGRQFVISEIKSSLEGSELVHQYQLCVLRSSYLAQTPFEAIKGIAMRGRVTGVRRTQVQVSFHEDENNTQSGSRYFDYATVYSSPDMSGLFAMPIEGDEIRIFFPNAGETGAYAINSVHVGASGGRENPENISWRNSYGMELLITPNTFAFTNNDGMSVSLSNLRGIVLNSDRGIFVQAKGPVQISSQTSVTVRGDRQLALQQGSAQINVKDAVDISGGKINMN